MLITTEGIVLKQTKNPSGGGVLTLFTKEYGKLPVNVNSLLPSRKKNMNLTLRPFTRGVYNIYKGKVYRYSSSEFLDSFFLISEDLDKYIITASIIELTDKAILEEEAMPALYDMLMDFLQVMQRRKTDFNTLALAYKLKLMDILGYKINVQQCVSCLEQKPYNAFCISQGGFVCKSCLDIYHKEIQPKEIDKDLIVYDDFDMITTIRYFLQNDIEKFEKISLKLSVQRQLSKLLNSYIAYHIGIDELSSERIFNTYKL